MRQKILPTIAWQVTLPKSAHLGRGVYQFGAPTVHEGVIYTGSASGGIFAIDTQGKRRWQVATPAPVYAPLALAADRVYGVDAEGTLYALAQSNGETLWQYDLGSEVMARPLVLERHIYVATMQGQLIAVEREQGVPLWHTPERLVIAPFTVRGASDPIWHRGQIVVGYADGRLVAHEPSGGHIRWEERIASRSAVLHDLDAAPLPLDGLIATASVGGGVALVDGDTGRLRWYDKISSPNNLTVVDRTLFVTGQGAVYALESSTGQVRWKAQLPESEVSAPAVTGGRVVVFSPNGVMYVLDQISGARLGERRIGRGTYGRPTVAGDRIYLLMNPNKLVALTL